MKPTLGEHPLFMHVFLSGSSLDRLLEKTHVLQIWSEWMEALNISLTIYVQHHLSLLAPMRHLFSCPVQFLPIECAQPAEDLECVRQKPVFGVSRDMAFSSLRLYGENVLLHQTRRVNPAAMEAAVKKALKWQYQWLVQAPGRFVDSPFESC